MESRRDHPSTCLPLSGRNCARAALWPEMEMMLPEHDSFPPTPPKCPNPSIHQLTVAAVIPKNSWMGCAVASSEPLMKTNRTCQEGAQ